MSACEIYLLEYGCSHEVPCIYCMYALPVCREPSTAAMRATWTLGARRGCTRSRCPARAELWALGGVGVYQAMATADGVKTS